ncbi:hypothetical protein C8A05DRAFT_33496 [Staphylotrichum tortipilum]|uniref:Uncharacterized protein n=1 Tax=Staphylotrichum tortipilum TaxID=2831512 RepID=A0AAN6MM45_9PEZI|nr:hypothetical protein C8A05DRAFT_33496 [Staphylotrichum longicolle]
MGTHRLVGEGGIKPVVEGGSLDAALRVVGLLVLKELLPEWPRNLGGYGVLLWLLRYHSGEMLREHRRLQHSPWTNPFTASQPLPAGDHLSVSPTTTPTTSRTATTAIPPRPILLFLTLLGTTLSHTADTNERRTPPSNQPPIPLSADTLADGVSFEDADRHGHSHGHQNPESGGGIDGGDIDGEEVDQGDVYPRGVYWDVVREMVGLASLADVEGLEEEDGVLFSLFECGMIFGGGVVDGEGWDWRGILRDVVLGL